MALAAELFAAVALAAVSEGRSAVAAELEEVALIDLAQACPWAIHQIDNPDGCLAAAEDHRCLFHSQYYWRCMNNRQKREQAAKRF